jgi:hypothetical protein
MDFSRIVSGGGRVIGPLLRHAALREACLLALVAVGGATIGYRYIEVFQRTGSGSFLQEKFGPAVGLACRRGFVNPGPSQALDAFLARRSDSLSCGELPPQAADVPATYEQRFIRYLLMAVAFDWKWFGVSWSRLGPLFALMFATTLCAAYGLFRFAGGPLVAFAGVVPLAVSVHHLGMLPELRDYAKAPFILLQMLIIALLAIPSSSPKRLLLLSSAFGLVLGIGLGFRPDLLIGVPPFLAVCLLGIPGKWRERMRLKIACIAVAGVTAVISAWPIVQTYGSEGATAHVAVLGFASGFDQSLGLTRPAYDTGALYLDEYAAALIGARSLARTGHAVPLLGPGYGDAASALATDIVRHWPADVAARGLASSLAMLDLPFSVGRFSAPIPNGLEGSFARGFYRAQANVLLRLSGVGLLVAIAAVMIIGASNLRAGVLLVLVLLYYCAYPAVQFQTRHFFHLEFVSWWALLFVLTVVCRLLWRALAERVLPVVDARSVARSIVPLVTIAVVTAFPLWVLRLYQQRHVLALLDAYVAAPRTLKSVSKARRADDTLMAIDDLWRGTAPEEVAVRYIAVELGGAACAAENLPLTAVYDARTYRDDFSTVTRIPIGTGSTTLRFMPVFHYQNLSRFVGLSVPARFDPCVKSVSVVDDVRRIPIPVEFTRTPGDRSHRWYQQLPDWEQAVGDFPLVYSRPAGLVARSDAGPHVPALSPDRMSPGVSPRPTGTGWDGAVVAGEPDMPFLHFPSRAVGSGDVLQATGMLHRGGVRIGVLQNDLWFDSQMVDTPGPFIVLIRAPKAGEFGALVSDASTREWRAEPSSLLRSVVRLVAPRLLVDDFELHDLKWIPAER